MMKILLCWMIITIGLIAKEMPNEKNLNMQNIQDKDFQAKKAMDDWLDGKLALQPYKTNYIMPYSYRQDNYTSYDRDIFEFENIEAELQVSVKLLVGADILGFNEQYYLSYSHKAYWQIYAESTPFRETNYSPEAFVVFPVSDRHSGFGLRTVTLAFAHNSNGQPEADKGTYDYHYQNPLNRSRSINFLYTEATFQRDTLIADIRLYARIEEDIDSDDNPDIMDYRGYSSIKLSYFMKKHMITLFGRGNIETGRGAVELTYSHPFTNNTFIYAKVFSGYGESLIDYNNNITKFAIGFSFSR